MLGAFGGGGWGPNLAVRLRYLKPKPCLLPGTTESRYNRRPTHPLKVSALELRSLHLANVSKNASELSHIWYAWLAAQLNF